MKMKEELEKTDIMLNWIEASYMSIREGEASPLVNASEYGGSLILKFKNGNKYKLTLQKWTPENIVLDSPKS